MKVIFVAIHRKTNDIPEYFREEAELVIPSYGYFIRGAQTTFTGVLRFVVNICLLTSDPLKQLFGSRITSNMDENLSQPSWRKRPPGPTVWEQTLLAEQKKEQTMKLWDLQVLDWLGFVFVWFQRSAVEVHPVQNDRLWLWLWKFIDCEQRLFLSLNSFYWWDMYSYT